MQETDIPLLTIMNEQPPNVSELNQFYSPPPLVLISKTHAGLAGPGTCLVEPIKPSRADDLWVQYQCVRVVGALPPSHGYQLMC